MVGGGGGEWEMERKREEEGEGEGVCMNLSGKVAVLDLVCTKTIQDARQPIE